MPLGESHCSENLQCDPSNPSHNAARHHDVPLPRIGNYKKGPKSAGTREHNKATVSQEGTPGNHGSNIQSSYLTICDPYNSSHDSGYESLKCPMEGSGSANYRASQNSGYLSVYDHSYEYIE